MHQKISSIFRHTIYFYQYTSTIPMKRILTALLLSPVLLFAQKKPLDHTVYDGWQSIGEKIISNDGRWLAWTVTP